jgi:hypothetical protein
MWNASAENGPVRSSLKSILMEDDSPAAFQLMEALLGKKASFDRIKAPTALMGG